MCADKKLTRKQNAFTYGGSLINVESLSMFLYHSASDSPLLFGLLSICMNQHMLLQRTMIEGLVLTPHHRTRQVLLLAALVLLVPLQRDFTHIPAATPIARKSSLFGLLVTLRQGSSRGGCYGGRRMVVVVLGCQRHW